MNAREAFEKNARWMIERFHGRDRALLPCESRWHRKDFRNRSGKKCPECGSGHKWMPADLGSALRGMLRS